MKSPADILDALGKPFPRNAIKKRQGGGGKMLDYVETHTVIHRLNSATNGEWTFHVKDVQWRNDLLMVLGELTIPGLGTRSGFGVQKVSDRGGEDLVKGASSDALKKCATLFGVALELYGADYEANVSVQAPQRPPDAPKPANAGTDTPAPKDMRSEALGRTLHGLVEHDFLHALAVKWGFTSFAEVPADNRQLALDYLNGKGDQAKVNAFNLFLDHWQNEHQRSARKTPTQGSLTPGTDEVPNPERFTS